MNERDTLYLSRFIPYVGKYGPEKILYLDTFHAVKTSLKRFRWGNDWSRLELPFPQGIF